MFLNQLPTSSDLALCHQDAKISYLELHQFIRQKIIQLEFIKPRDVVWIDCKNNINTIILFFALWQKEACVVPIDSELGQIEKKYLYQEIPPQHVLCENQNDEFLNNLKTDATQNNDILDAALVQLSSGSTGLPKIILISPQALVFRAISNRDHLQISAADKTLCSVPLSHSHGLDCLTLPTLFAGGTVYLTDPKTSFPYRILDWIEKHNITFFSSLPQMYDFFNQAAAQKKYNLSSMRHAFCGSAALAENTAIDFYKNFNLPLKQGYGLAEIGVICVNLKTSEKKYHSIGEPIPGIEWHLADDGELCVKSDSLFSGYYKNSQATAERMNGKFLKTEDLISIDDDGFFYVTGRKNDVINVMGQKLYPKEIEQFILNFKEIAESCVTSRSDEKRGQIPVLHLIAKNRDLNKINFEKKIISEFSQQFEDFKIPRTFVWHDAFPKSPLGKILKSKL